jgi:2-methylcitrate dehydratase PrpD
MKKVTDAFLDLALNTAYEDLPENVVHEAKRTLLNGIGVALGGIASDKGKIGVEVARKTGGIAESTIIGVGGKYSAGVAALANAELMNGLDMDPVPHIQPFTVPVALAVAEAEKATGKELIRATVIGYEIARRISAVLMSKFSGSSKSTDVAAGQKPKPKAVGNSNEHIIGAAVGAAMLMQLDRERMGHTIGISAYYCPVPTDTDWNSTDLKSMIKYTPVSWCAHGAVQAAMMAREGYTGNPYTLDSPTGFPVFYSHEVDIWDPAKVIEGIGEDWKILNSQYKLYPCCRVIHSSLDMFYKLKEKYNFSPNEVIAVRLNTDPFTAGRKVVNSQIDAQFSMQYSIALAAYGYAPGPMWQNTRLMKDPNILSFMKKVTNIAAPECVELKKKDKATYYSRVEIDLTNGTTISEATEYARATNIEGYRLTDEDIKECFRTCASVILPDSKTERAIDIIMNLEQYSSLDELIANISL